MPIDEKKLNKLKRLESVVRGGNAGILQYLFDMEEKMEEMRKELSPEIKELVTQIKGKDGVDGLDGNDGKDYVLTEKDKKQIANSITVPIVEKIIEKTETIREIPIVLKEITEQRIENPISGEMIVAKINDLEIEPRRQIDVDHIKGIDRLIKTKIDGQINILNDHRGGSKNLYQLNDVNLSGITDNQSIRYSSTTGLWTPFTPGSGGGYTKETPTGAVNSGNTTFIVTSVPVYIVADGSTYFENAGYAISGLEVEMTDAPTQFIRSFY